MKAMKAPMKAAAMKAMKRATKSGLTCLITVHLNSCCSMRAPIGLKGFEARIWSITFPFRSAVCPAR